MFSSYCPFRKQFVLSLTIERCREEKFGHHYLNAAQAQMVRFISITNIE